QAVGNNALAVVKEPFSLTDLRAYKKLAGSYQEDPERVAQVFETIIKTQDPDWTGIQVLLGMLLDSTEEVMVLKTARQQAEAAYADGNLLGTLVQNFPDSDPQWNPNHPAQKKALIQYQRWILYGIRHAMPQAINWSKLYDVKQGPNETPSDYV
ncbi:hypothetical protein N324_03934, partial [Chlamydotis macqueenii]